MKNIHLIKTDKPSRLILDKDDNILHLQIEDIFMEHQDLVENQNIYITSDKKIKGGSYYLCKLSMKLLKCIGNEYFNNIDEKKIILTTDLQLIADGVQAIDDEFLQWFVENSTCEFVNIKKVPSKLYVSIEQLEQYKSKPKEMQFEHSSNIDECYSYKIIIPKEETKPIHQKIIDIVGGEDRFREIAKIKPKHLSFCETPEDNCSMNYCDENGCQNRKRELVGEPIKETLEDVCDRILLGEGLDLSDYDKRHILKAMVNITKWQAERMYNEEDMINFAWYLKESLGLYADDKAAHFKGEYLKRFKKKQNDTSKT